MKPYFQFPEDKTEAAKELWKQTLSEYKEILKAKKVFAVTKTQKAFRLFIVGDPRTQWDKIVHEMHTKEPWIRVNRSSNEGPRTRFWPSFLDCIELHKLTIFHVDAAAAEKQCYYITQMVKKPQWATVRQYMARMGILNDYLAHLSPHGLQLSHGRWGNKEGKRAIRWGWSSRNCLELSTVSWMNHYNMTHMTLPEWTRTLPQDLKLIEHVMDEKHEAAEIEKS